MCGIIGAINLDYNKNFLDTLSHRGPDDRGLFNYQNVTLAHLRLSILDPSRAGHQPMSTEDDKLVITFNGEIYNHIQIRKELINNGIKFGSNSDTETLLKGWQYWGKNVLKRLNGIFAFALLDKQKNKLYLARDNFGVKPLYIYEKGNKFAFSSELKMFGQLEKFDDKLEPNAFLDYLSFLYSPGQKTPYKYVRKLLPGHMLEMSLNNTSSGTEEKYYSVPFDGDYFTSISETELVNKLDSVLRRAVDRQLLSDVPLGFFLSGGLDSSLVVSIAKHLYPDTRFNCFTIDSKMDKGSEGFEDDLPYAKKIARDLDVDLHIIPADYDIAEQFDHMIWHLDEPQADPAPINVYNISKEARNLGIKVLLGGTGGDDLFSGYRRHKALKIDQYLEFIPTRLRKLLKGGLGKLPSDKVISRRLQKLSRDWDKPLDKRMLGYFNWLPNDEYVLSLFQNNILNGTSSQSVYSYFNKMLDQQSSTLSSLDRLLYLEIKTFLVDHNLNYTDKMSMAAGVEARVPYLDKELVQFAGKVPEEYKLRSGETKYLLKKVAERYLPKEVIYRSKTGFGAPIRTWLKNELKPMVNDRLNKEHLLNQGIFDPEAIEKMIEQNDSGKFDFSYTIWSLLAIQSWLKQFKWSL